MFPILMAGFAQAYVFYVLPEFRWVSPLWLTRGVPMYLSFAFWEWVTCAVLSAYMVVLSLAAQQNRRARRTGGRATRSLSVPNNRGHPGDRP
jgi:hypothetical protein